MNDFNEDEQQPNIDTSGYAKYMFIALWICVFILLTVFFGYWEKKKENPNQQPESYETSGVRTLILQRNWNNHYVVSGKVNGKLVEFLLDTGATAVVIPAHLQQSLGLKRGFAGQAMTANGAVTTYATRIDTLQIGKIVLHNVNAALNPGMTDDQILLGMSALKEVDFSQRDGKLIIHQRVK